MFKKSLIFLNYNYNLLNWDVTLDCIDSWTLLYYEMMVMTEMRINYYFKIDHEFNFSY